ncbi:CRISPR-associated Cas5h family protein [Caldicellulosiruptor bescii]|jgi:CRISPR-associated protein Cas5h|uniref:CRISPR-associated protein Cas5, Hmari subtype n=2 Tax=Caldicellulosiruptor bescii TaxID=31899 RepID=B9MPU1_CALBD|nr:type I-B CRISPR-associated protein Cas5b [Caldicellulosiruptor bescii]ACM61724.1 CRISPR-associated protein Cas5, Hmari subtype [Caldicellulosiruptor bescii DSM 6725]PBC88474.1 CRISPR-associated Cas5h family protein [Caldicellulosiruptor bescii]PBC92045.1 CRISPR-associated Cas5h family protein [Caldicellulosiruptor bescii]PBD02542.1 CRISPR-associated Cas5h family protein [Caldicellulosiruptor bescii]PBD05224.1 CRISPR-associated Cas5h family protein [Caldicellulosiruptor bescii]
MKFLVFDLKGKFAHFRKFYTNSSSLSYLVPPRTVIEGMVAAILGFERDSYYDMFSAENLLVAVQKLEKTYKIVQTVNYIKAQTISELKNPNTHTQVPLEILAGYNGFVGFRVFVMPKDEKIYSFLRARLESGKSEFPIYFGSAPFAAKIEFLGEFEACRWEDSRAGILTVLDTGLIKSLNLSLEFSSSLALMKDRMPCDFDKDRFATKVKTYIHDENLNPIWVDLNSSAQDKVYYIKEFSGDRKECICVM